MEPFYADDPWFTYIPSRSSKYQHQNWAYPPRQVLLDHPQPTKPTPRVVSIPVQHAAQEHERRRSDLLRSCMAAVRIQRVFRGFLVRKSVVKIQEISREVERVSRKEVEEMVRKDAKERLKVVETLMSLLLKLDSVKGVDTGVRDLRKRVIKKAIALQEKVESAADSGTCNVSDGLNETKKNTGVMEKMVKENERLVGLVEELVRRNEKQAVVLGSLAQRVEVLERALASDRLRKKKKRQALGTLDYCGGGGFLVDTLFDDFYCLGFM